MQQEMAEKIKANPKFAELVRRRKSLGWTLSFIMLVVYYGYIMLIAFYPGFFRTHIGEYTTIGFPIGVGIIVVAFILTGIYVRQSNRVFDKLVEEIKQEAKS